MALFCQKDSNYLLIAVVVSTVLSVNTLAMPTMSEEFQVRNINIFKK